MQLGDHDQDEQGSLSDMIRDVGSPAVSISPLGELHLVDCPRAAGAIKVSLLIGEHASVPLANSQADPGEGVEGEGSCLFPPQLLVTIRHYLAILGQNDVDDEGNVPVRLRFYLEGDDYIDLTLLIPVESIDSKQFVSRSIDSGSTEGRYRGCIENIGETLDGWILDVETFEPVEFQVEIDGLESFGSFTSQARQDLLAAFNRENQCGFSIPLSDIVAASDGAVLEEFAAQALNWPDNILPVKISVSSSGELLRSPPGDGHSVLFLKDLATAIRSPIETAFDPIAEVDFAPETIVEDQPEADLEEGEFAVEEEIPEIIVRESKLLFFPDYTSTNPYQDLLYSGLSEEWDCQGGTITEAIAAAQSGARVVFHLHWPEPVFAGCTTSDQFLEVGSNFIKAVEQLQRLGGRFVWTVHNVLPHDKERAERYRRFLNDVSAKADVIHVHSAEAIPIVSKELEIDARKCVILPHGNYLGVYPDGISKEEARKRLGLDMDATVFAFVGQLRPYKGLDTLLEAFGLYRSRGGRGELLIAGKPVAPTRPGYWKNLASITDGLTVEEGYIRDQDLQIYFAAADVIVLPYRDILTSGSVLLSCSYARGVIVPALDALRDISGEGFTIEYDPGSAESLSQCMDDFEKLAPKDRAILGEKALVFAKQRAWEGISKGFEEQMLLSGPSFETTSIAGRSVAVARRASPVPDIGIAIVNYRSAADVEALLETIPSTVGTLSVGIYILDNSNSPTEVDALTRLDPGAAFVVPEENLGYAAGNNVLIDLMRRDGCRYCFIVNPDIRLEDGALDALLDAVGDEEYFVANPLVLKPDGKISFAGGFIRKSGDVSVIHHLDGASIDAAPTEPYEVDVLNGCAVLFSLNVIDKAGPIPEDYFLYYEETDWFLRIGQCGIKRSVVPLSRVVHEKKSHGSGVPTFYYLYYLLRNAYLFNVLYDGSPGVLTRRLQNGFIKGWLDKVKSAHPSFVTIFERTVRAAVSDGKAGVSGPVALGARLDAENSAEYESIGYVDTFTDKELRGWLASRPVNGTEWTGQNAIWLIVDDVAVSELVASESRYDTLEAGYAERTGFRIPIPPSLRDGGSHRFEVRCAKSGLRLPFLDGEYAAVRTFAPAHAAVTHGSLIKGRIEGIHNGSLVGWAYDVSNPDRPVVIDVEIGGTIIPNVLVDTYRADLLKAGFGNGKHAFSLPLSIESLKEEKTKVRLRYNGRSDFIAEREITPSFNMNGYSVRFNVTQFMKWSYVNYESPVGSFQRSVNLQKYFNTNRLVLSAIPSAPESRPTISVIMPLFNRETVVIEAIESVVMQTYENWELIIVDDGSVDNSVAVVKDFIATSGDKRIKFLALDENKGVSAARNVGLAAASGEWIAYLDSDNQWYPEFLQIVANSTVSSPEFSVFYAGQEIWEYIDHLGRDELRSIRACPFNRSKLELRNFIDLNVFVHKRGLVEVYGGFREDMRRLVDWELILRYTKDKPPLFIPVLMNRYAVNKVDNQITKVENYGDNLAKLRAAQA